MDIEEIYRKSFSDEEKLPSNDLWESIEEKLDDESIERLYQTTFKNDRIIPPVSIWSKIGTKLWMREFITFTPSKLNVYYVAVAVISTIGVLLYNSNNDNIETQIVEQSSTEVKQEIVMQQAVNQNKKLQLQTVTNTNTQPIISTPIEQKNTVNQHIEQSISVKETAETQTEAESLVKTDENINPVITEVKEPTVKFSIIGKNTICCHSTSYYELDNITANEVNWKLSGNGDIEELENGKIKIDWTKIGNALLTAQVKLSNNKIVEQSINIAVVENTIPEIEGKNLVCEGSDDITYRVNNAKDLDKIYSWESKVNPIKIISNGFISVDWNKVGTDTLILTDINTKTNCKYTVKFPVVVLPRPAGKVEYTRIVGNEYEFKFKAIQVISEKSLKYNWYINNDKYSDSEVNYEFPQGGTYNVELIVTDKNKCSSLIKETIIVNSNNLYVPDAFVPTSREANIFIPFGENLANYKIEIFSSSNVKLWESSELIDGKPAVGWNGTYNGQLQPYGTYVWKITAQFSDGTKWPGILVGSEYSNVGKFFMLKNK